MISTWQSPRAGEHAVQRIAQLIALKLHVGDIISLQGDLGTGKTTLARALIRAGLGKPDYEVPSPTFALMQSYADARVPISHLDLYRLQDDDELTELGLEEILQTGALVVEWPDRLPDLLADNRLAIALSDTDDTDYRTVSLTGTGTWAPRLARLQRISEFLETQHQWDAARIQYLQGDASARSYARLVDVQTPALLMDSPAQPDGPSVRDGKTYSQLAALAEDIRPFVAVAGALQEAGLSAPKIFAADLAQGLLILEDFGDQVFGAALDAGADQRTLWRAATDVLIQLRRDTPDHTWTFPDQSSHRLPVLTADLMQTESDLLIDWYWSMAHGTPATSATHVPTFKPFVRHCLAPLHAPTAIGCYATFTRPISSGGLTNLDTHVLALSISRMPCAARQNTILSRCFRMRALTCQRHWNKTCSRITARALPSNPTRTRILSILRKLCFAIMSLARNGP